MTPSYSHMLTLLCRPALCLVLIVLVGCVGSGPNIVGLGETMALSPEDGAARQQVFFATTRDRSDDPAEFFSGERADGMTLGRVDVTIPPDHEVGRIERPNSGDPDPSKHFIVKTPALFSGDAIFQNRLRAALAEREPGERDILVFVHGYNVNFSAAVLRIAQFVNDTGYRGVPVLFTWASRGRTLDYVYDINSALQARDSLEALAVILSQVPADNVDVVAHSMGNLLVIETMLRLEKRGDLASAKNTLRRVMLASPDIDVDLFEAQLTAFPDVKDRFFVFVSEDDRALSFSRRIAGGVSRVGATDPVRLSELGVNVIDLTQVPDRSSAHHTKFAAAPGVVQLIGRGIQEGNTLSAREEPGTLQSITEEMVRGITFIPSALLSDTPVASQIEDTRGHDRP